VRTRLIDIIGEIATRRPAALLLLSAILGAVGVWLGLTRLPLDADTDHLIRADRPFMVRYQRFLDEFGDIEYIFAVVDTRPDEGKALAAASALEARLRGLDGLRFVSAGVTVDEQLRIATRAAPESALEGLALAGEGLGALASAASTEGDVRVLPLARFAAALLGEAIRSPVEVTEEADATGGGQGASSGLRRGPAAQAAASGILILRALLAGSEPDQAASLGVLSERHQSAIPLRADGGRYLVIRIQPVKDFTTSTVIEGPLRAIRSAMAATALEFPGVDMGLTGKPVLQADELITSNADMVRGAVVGLLLCALLLMVSMHGVVRPLLCVASFVLAFAWTCGFAAIAVGRLNLLSMVFMLVLVANGLDYGVHVIARYLEVRATAPRSTVAAAVQGAVRSSLRGNLTGALTSCAVFLTALATNFQGLRELGVIASAGLMLCVLAMGSALPALLVLVERRHAFRVPQLARSTADSRFLGLPVRHPRVALLGVAAVTALLMVALPRLYVQENLLELQDPTLDSVRWERRLAEESAGNSWFGAVVVDEPGQVEQVVERAKAEPAIGAIRSVLDVIQVPTPQREQRMTELQDRAERGAARFEALRGDGGSQRAADAPRAIAAALESALPPLRIIAAGASAEAPAEAVALRELISATHRAVVRLESRRGGQAEGQSPEARAAISEEAARQRREMERAAMVAGAASRVLLAGNASDLRSALPEAIRATAMSPAGRFLVMLHPRENIWDVEHMQRFIEGLRAVDAEATGVPFTHFESLVDMRRAFLTMAGLSVLLVAILLFIDFRRLVDVGLALLPLGLSLLWTLSLMGVFGVPLNLANFFAIPILIGLGVDGAVHLLHRHHEPGNAPLDPGSTRRAFVLANLTTSIGFAPLLFASHQGMHSLGVVMVLGNTANLLAMLLVLPATLSLRERWKASRGLGPRPG